MFEKPATVLCFVRFEIASYDEDFILYTWSENLLSQACITLYKRERKEGKVTTLL